MTNFQTFISGAAWMLLSMLLLFDTFQPGEAAAAAAPAAQIA